MKFKKLISLVAAIALNISIIAAPILFSPSEAMALSWTQVNSDGFGDPTNILVIGTAEFNNMLYVAAGNLVAGVNIYRSADGTTWTQCNTSGFGNVSNGEAVLAVYNNALYALTMDEVGPNAAFELWKTADGTTWTQVGTAGFGDPNDIGSTGMAVFHDKLYIGTSNTVAGATVYRVNSDDSWDKVASAGFGDAGNLQVYALNVFGGNIYVGTANFAGAEVWRSSNGTDWTQVADAGFGDAANLRVCSLFDHKNYIYAGTLNANGTEIWRSTDGVNWTQTGSDGLGDPTNIWTGIQVAVINDIIYLGTRKNPPNAAELFVSTDGVTWTQEGTDGFGDPNNYALYSITFNGRIYLAFSSALTGAEIWRSETMNVLTITTQSLSEGTKNSNYSANLSREYGSEPFKWSVSSGSLPDGLTINENDGTISGKPTRAGSYTFTVSVIDTGAPQQLASRSYTIKINDEVLPETGVNTKLTHLMRGIVNF